MSIPLPTTTIAVLVPDGDADPYEDRVDHIASQGVRAHFSSPSGSDLIVGGDQESIDMRLICDECVLPFTATVIDESTNERWSLVWVRPRKGLGVDHLEAGVRRVQGVVPS